MDSSWSLRQSSEKSFHMCVLLSLPTQPQLHASIACRVGNTPLARTSQSAWGDDITHPGERERDRESRIKQAVLLNNDLELNCSKHLSVWSVYVFYHWHSELYM